MLISSFIFIRLISVSLAPAAPARSTVVLEQGLQIRSGAPDPDAPDRNAD